MKNRFLKLTVLAAILLTLFACSKGVPDSSGSERWSLTDLPLPSGYVLDPMEIPDCDPEEETVRLYAFTVRNDGGTILCENRRLTLSLDGDVLEETEIPLPSTERITLALFSEEADTFLSVDSDPKARRYILYKRIAKTGELQSVLLTDYYPAGERTEPDYLTADAEGVLYIGIGKALLLFDADLNYLKTMTFPGKEFSYNSLGRSADGRILLTNTWSVSSENGKSLSEVDKTADRVAYGSQFNSMGAIPAFPTVSDETGSFYAWSKEGLWSMTPGAADQYSAEQLADFAAENLRFLTGIRKSGHSRIALPVRDDFFLCTKCKLREGIAVADLCVLSFGVTP